MSDCPLKLDKIHCASCAFSKENLCDYPYTVKRKSEIITLELRREEALVCVIALERKKKLCSWQQGALTKLLKAMGLKSKEGNLEVEKPE